MKKQQAKRTLNSLQNQQRNLYTRKIIIAFPILYRNDGHIVPVIMAGSWTIPPKYPVPGHDDGH